MALGQTALEEIDLEIVELCSKYENGLSLGQGHVAQGGTYQKSVRLIFESYLVDYVYEV